MELRKLIKQYIEEKEIMQLATVSDGNPWICTVNYVFDEDLSLYWMSLRSTRHSKELKIDPRTAVAILVESKEKKCIHLEGSSYEVPKENLEFANKLYADRYGNKPKRLEEAKSGDEKLRAYYVFNPKRIVLFDENSDNERQELEI